MNISGVTGLSTQADAVSADTSKDKITNSGLTATAEVKASTSSTLADDVVTFSSESLSLSEQDPDDGAVTVNNGGGNEPPDPVKPN